MAQGQKVIVFVVVWIFFILRYAFDENIAVLHDYVSYAIELIFVAIAGFFFKDQINWKITLTKKSFTVGAVALGAGYGIYEFAVHRDIVIPFEFNTALPIFFLLIVAPFLEELLFRFVLIGANNRFVQNQYVLIGLSAIAFSMAHFNALRYVPEVLRGFVIYQGIYTFLLGSACAVVYIRTNRRILNAIGVHFLFNLGFYLASLY